MSPGAAGGGGSRHPLGTEAGGGAAVVIVTYESGDALSRCVASWRAERPAGVVVVDNGSSDGSVARLARDFPDVEIVRPGRNLGYGAAANRGVAATGSERVVVSNSDLEVHPGALGALLTALDGDTACGLVGPLIRTAVGDRYPSARRFPSLVDAAGHAVFGLFVPHNRFTRSYQRSELDDTGSTERGPVGPQSVDWVSGACFAVRREAFEQVGGFDEAYFMYAEDVDLCWRLGRAGWGVAYVPAAEVTHLQGVSTDRHPYRMIVEHHRSLLRFAGRSTVGWRRLLLPLVALGIGVRAALATLARFTDR